VTYWHGVPSPSLIQTDELQIGDTRSERAHHYLSPESSDSYTITSRYEWGVDTLDGKELYPAETDHGRITKGISEFTMHLRRDNVGVLLRRKLDYKFPNQSAEVYVANRRGAKWNFAGIRYLAGSNSSIYSNPSEELGATEQEVKTSNRRFRDDEFLISRALTKGTTEIRVRVKFTPVNQPLYPGFSPGKQAWSEIKYSAYCFVTPMKR